MEALDEFNDYTFNLENIVEQAKVIISEEVRAGRMIEGEFNSDKWRFISITRHNTLHINFGESPKIPSLQNGITKKITAIKCWIATLIPNYSIETIKSYYEYLKEFLLLSHNLDETFQEQVQLYLLHKCDDRKRWNLCIPTLNFLDFYEEFDKNQLYTNLLLSIKKDININNVMGLVRSLPSAQDILAFSWVLEDFFLSIQKEDKNYLRYAPIAIWWEISNLIPMRPSEFCGIERNCLVEENNRFYIRLPRLKQKENTRKIQVIDKISIPFSVFSKLKNYISLTDPFGESETLISSSSIRLRKLGSRINYFENRFTYNNLCVLLDEFYKNIVEEIYKISYKNRIRLGDTRHFAFLNLMRQGYHPVEIARLGGHTSLQAQYHYQQHLTYWVDVEIVQLMQRFNFFRENDARPPKNINNYSKNHSFYYLDDEFIQEKVLKRNSTGFKTEVEIGFCTDPNMYCQVDKCFYCEHWQIDSDEYLQKQKEIEAELQSCKNEIQRLIKTMNDLYRIALNESFENDLSEFSQEYNKDLFYTKSQLDHIVNKTIHFSNRLVQKGK
ncbi:site-specific integrase [Bacillus mobilis]|uniref:site-specific integrase n=1 Tax=Bacillus mobilis TaxID=2026190 RepID=UPI002FDC5506